MSEVSKEKKAPLSWSRAAAGAALALAVVLTVAIVFNVAIGRTIHWDIVAALGGAGFLGLTLAFRYAR